MSRLPAKRKRPKMGVREQIQRVFPRHRKFVKTHGCCVPGCLNSPVDFAHVETRGAGGSDDTGVSLCRAHHSEQHAIGIETFQRKYGIDLWAMAAEFVRRTPDVALRQMIRERYMGKEDNEF